MLANDYELFNGTETLEKYKGNDSNGMVEPEADHFALSLGTRNMKASRSVSVRGVNQLVYDLNQVWVSKL